MEGIHDLGLFVLSGLLLNITPGADTLYIVARGTTQGTRAGAVAALGLTALEDDKGAQVVYAPAPVVREAVLQQHPEIAKLLDPVFASLSLETLQQLNAKIAVEGEDAGAVAAAYLKSQHFLP